MRKIFTNGCFDILHPGHLALLKYCATMGDYVLVGIDSDRRVQEMKAQNRPIQNQEIRRIMLLNLKWVNDVVIFDTDEELEQLVKNYDPYCMIVGSDWQDKKVIGSEHAEVIGYFERIDEYSTSKIVESIIDGRKLSRCLSLRRLHQTKP